MIWYSTIILISKSAKTDYSLMHKKTEESILRFLLIKSSKNYFIFLPVFYLVMSLMKAQKNFGKIAILKI